MAKIKNIGIDINLDTIINETYLTYRSRLCAKICPESNFKTGLILFEDGVFLPENTYVIIKEKGKPDKIGKIFYYKSIHNFDNSYMEYEKAVVDIHYDMNSSKNRLNMNDKLVIDFINKSLHIQKSNPNKYLQIISYKHEPEIDDWTFVKVEYGNPNVKMFYMYGYQYWDGTVHVRKDASSPILSCFDKYHHTIKIIRINESNLNNTSNNTRNITIYTNKENKIKYNGYVPYELESIIVFVIILGVTFIFKGWFFYWIVETIIFILYRKKLRDKWNG